MRQERKANFLASAIESPVVLDHPARNRAWVAVPFHLVETAVICADFVLVVGTSVLAALVYHAMLGVGLVDLWAFLGIGAGVALNFAGITAARGNYKPYMLTDFWEQVRELSATWFTVCSLLLAIAFSLKISDSYSRGATLTFFVAGWCGLIAWRAFLARSVERAFARGGFAEQRIVVLAGEGQVAASNMIEEIKRCGYRPIRTFEVSLGGSAQVGISSDTRNLLDDLVEACRRERIDEVFLLLPWQYRRAIEEIMEVLRVLSIPIHLLPDENVAHFLGSRTVSVGTAWSAELKRAPLTRVEQAVKRIFDLTVASAALIMLAPLMILVAVLVRIETRGPVFFVQTRNGFNGRTFGARKFRTMHVLEDGAVVRQATQNDPRVTHVGRILRRTSIDELPQLFNVIAGDMSLVGPRPHAVAHNSEFQKLIGNYAYRHHMKPGITGWAQVNGLRGEIKSVDMMERRVEFDLWYIDNWSVWLDAKILLKTLIVLGLQRNAY